MAKLLVVVIGAVGKLPYAGTIVDPIAKGAKVLRQAKVLGWPAVFTADDVTDAALGKAFDWVLTEDARIEARGCRMRAAAELQEVRDRFLAAFTESDSVVEA